jgi:hypothetical protein
MNITRISLKQTTENIQIPDWAKTIVIHADTTAPYSEKKLQQIYWLFFKTLGITDESRKKYTLRFHVRFDRPDCDYYVEFADMILNDRVRFWQCPGTRNLGKNSRVEGLRFRASLRNALMWLSTRWRMSDSLLNLNCPMATLIVTTW